MIAQPFTVNNATELCRLRCNRPPRCGQTPWCPPTQTRAHLKLVQVQWSPPKGIEKGVYCVSVSLSGTGFQSAAQRDGDGPITTFSDAPAIMSSQRMTGMISGLPFNVAD